MELTEQARNLDLADRHLNAHSSKYMFKVDKVEEAHATMALFSRELDSGLINVHEMQTVWFEHHCGNEAAPSTIFERHSGHGAGSSIIFQRHSGHEAGSSSTSERQVAAVH